MEEVEKLIFKVDAVFSGGGRPSVSCLALYLNPGITSLMSLKVIMADLTCITTTAFGMRVLLDEGCSFSFLATFDTDLFGENSRTSLSLQSLHCMECRANPVETLFFRMFPIN